jgi:pimeloyl-ACP methyl ester carboxylesterase
MYVEHLRIPVGPGSLHAERLGRGGPPVLLIHGFGTCTFLWRHVAPVLAQAGYTVLSVDLLGYGESDQPQDAAYTPAAQAEYLARAVAALRLSEITVVGQDIGAIVALLVATNPRSRLTSAILVSPSDPDDLPGAPIRALQRASAKVVLSANSLFGAKALLEPLLLGAVSDPASMPERLIARYLAPYVGPEGASQLLQRAAALEVQTAEREAMALLACPVLIAEGATGSPRPSLSWASVLPLAPVTFERIPDAGTLLPEEAPEAFAALLLAWLTRQRSASSGR